MGIVLGPQLVFGLGGKVDGTGISADNTLKDSAFGFSGGIALLF